MSLLRHLICLLRGHHFHLLLEGDNLPIYECIRCGKQREILKNGGLEL